VISEEINKEEKEIIQNTLNYKLNTLSKLHIVLHKMKDEVDINFEKILLQKSSKRR